MHIALRIQVMNWVDPKLGNRPKGIHYMPCIAIMLHACVYQVCEIIDIINLVYYFEFKINVNLQQECLHENLILWRFHLDKGSSHSDLYNLQLLCLSTVQTWHVVYRANSTLCPCRHSQCMQKNYKNTFLNVKVTIYSWAYH